MSPDLEQQAFGCHRRSWAWVKLYSITLCEPAVNCKQNKPSFCLTLAVRCAPSILVAVPACAMPFTSARRSASCRIGPNRRATAREEKLELRNINFFFVPALKLFHGAKNGLSEKVYVPLCCSIFAFYGRNINFLGLIFASDFGPGELGRNTLGGRGAPR